MVHQAADILGHIDQGVGHLAAHAEGVAHNPALHRPGRFLPVQLGGQSAIAIVEPDHPVALVKKLTAEPVRPHGELGRHSHDQDDGGIAGVAQVFVEEFDIAVACDARSGGNFGGQQHHSWIPREFWAVLDDRPHLR
ncbi:Uncharacterised protein [Mycobacteroides abscessus subsp. abscessus]|nr:Uncharacterised protein [Mycobacteroides abscessus subsp. abscessus]